MFIEQVEESKEEIPTPSEGKFFIYPYYKLFIKANSNIIGSNNDIQTKEERKCMKQNFFQN